jgi:putative transposase
MPHSHTQLYVHFVWATWNCTPIITPEIEAPRYACIARECQNLKCEVIGVGGTTDHVHALVRLYPTVPVAALAKAMKGASSHLVTHALQPGAAFKWQGTYGAFSVSPNHVKPARAYVERQKEHHANATTHLQWERTADLDEQGAARDDLEQTSPASDRPGSAPLK